MKNEQPFTGDRHNDYIKLKLMDVICKVHNKAPQVTIENNPFKVIYKCCCSENEKVIEAILQSLSR